MFRMPKKETNHEFLKMALAGFESEMQKIDVRIQEVRALLGGGAKTSTPALDEVAPVRKRRKMSAAARKRIGDATRKRWALGRMGKKTTTKKRVKLSPAERARISGGQAKSGKRNEVPF